MINQFVSRFKEIIPLVLVPFLLSSLISLKSWNACVAQNEAFDYQSFKSSTLSPTVSNQTILSIFEKDLRNNNDPSKAKVLLCAKELAERSYSANDTEIVNKLVDLAKDRSLPIESRILLLQAIIRPGTYAFSKLRSLAMDQEEPAELRGFAVIAMNTSRQEVERQAIKYWIELIDSDKHPELISSALWCMYDRDIPESIEPIVRKLNDPQKNIRLSAIRALCRPDGKSSFQKASKTPALIKLLDDPDPLIVNASVRGLAALKASEAIPKMEQLINESKVKEPVDLKGLRWNIVRALGEMESVQSERLLKESIDDPDDLVVAYVAESMVKRKMKSELPRLKKRMALIKRENAYSKSRIDASLRKLEKN